MNLCKILTFEKNSECHLVMVNLLPTTVRTAVVLFDAILPLTVHISGRILFIFFVK